MNRRVPSALVPVLGLCLVLSGAARAQTPAGAKTGRIIGRAHGGQWRFEMIDNLPGHKDLYPPMKTAMLHVMSVVAQAPVVRPPKGFEVSPSLSVFAPWPDRQTHPVQASLTLPVFNYDAGGGRGEESHGGLTVYVNDVREVLPDRLKTVASDAGVPPFFLLPDVTRRGGLVAVGDNVMIVKKADRPLLIPLSTERFVRFMIGKRRKDLSAAKSDVDDAKEGLAEYRATPPQYRDAATLKLVQANVANAIRKVADEQQSLQASQQSLAAMSAAERRAPVYVVRSDHPDFDIYQRVPSSTPGAQELYTIDSGYYDPAAPRTAIQVIAVEYHESHFGPAYLRQRLRDWFHQVDYAALERLLGH